MLLTPRVIVRLPVLGLGTLPPAPHPWRRSPLCVPAIPPFLSPFCLYSPPLPDALDHFPAQKASREREVLRLHISSSVFNSWRRALCIKQMGMIPVWAGSRVSPVELTMDIFLPFAPCSPALLEQIPHLLCRSISSLACCPPSGYLRPE